MITSLLNLIFSVFSSNFVMYCAAFALCIALFGLIRRFFSGNWRMN